MPGMSLFPHPRAMRRKLFQQFLVPVPGMEKRMEGLSHVEARWVSLESGKMKEAQSLGLP